MRHYFNWKPKPVSFSPSAKAEAEARVASEVRPLVHEKADGRTRCAAHICPARIFARHPDRALRRLAREQAQAQHEMWGPCTPWLQPRTRRIISANPREPKPGLRPFRPATIQYGCIGASDL